MDLGRVVNVMNNLIKRDIETGNPTDEATGMQGVILHFIKGCGTEVYSKDIEEEFALRRATASGYLTLMERNGMIVREDVPDDRRLKRIVLTAKAEELLIGIEENIARNEAKIADGLSDGEVKEFLRIAGVITKNLRG